MPLFGRKKREPEYKLLAVAANATVGGRRGTILIIGKSTGKEWRENRVFTPGLNLHGSDINAAFDTPLDEPLAGGVILKFRTEAGGWAWWVELNKDAYDREVTEAKNLEKAGNHEEAAIKYESLGMYEDAGRVRHRAKARYEYKVVVDFAQLTSQLGKKGMSLTVIDCPNCGGKVDVPKSGNVFTCKYCGKNIHAVDVFEKFKGILGL